MKNQTPNFQVMTDKIALNLIHGQLLNYLLTNGLAKMFGNEISELEVDTFSPAVAGLGINTNSHEYDDFITPVWNALISDPSKDSDLEAISDEVLLRLKVEAFRLGVKRKPVTKEIIIDLLKQAFIIEAVSNIFISINMQDSYFDNLKPYILDDIFALCGIKDDELLDDLAGQFNDISEECKTRKDAQKLAELFYEVIVNPDMEYCLHYLDSPEGRLCHKCKRRGKAA